MIAPGKTRDKDVDIEYWEASLEVNLSFEPQTNAQPKTYFNGKASIIS
mgnify:CR=1 FL=1